MRRIYRHFDLPLSDEAEQAMRNHLTKNKKDAEGPHVYSLGEFGLDPDVERERYSAYWNRWGSPAGA